MMQAAKTLLVAVTATALLACSQTDEDWVGVPLANDTYYGNEDNYQEQEFEIFLLNQSEREFKLGLEEGDVITYQWSVNMDQPELLTAEFHGHTHREGDEPGTVMFYKKHNDGKEHGALVAPFDGIHGWYLKNDSDQDITVKLRVGGFFAEVD